MKKLLWLASLATFVGVLSGCGSDEERQFQQKLNAADRVYREELEAKNELADACEKNEPESKLAGIRARVAALERRRQELCLTDEMKRKLKEKYEGKFKAVGEKLIPFELREESDLLKPVVPPPKLH